MVLDLFFESVKEHVREICDELHYKCSFSCSEYIFVYARRNRNGHFIISSSLVDIVSFVDGVSFVAFSVGDDGLPYALFTFNEITDGDSVESN